jgi:cysteine-rich repeat protein
MRHSGPFYLALLSAAALLVVTSGEAAAATTLTGGTIINQTWTTAGSPYLVQGDLTVPAGAFLKIQPGVEVQFAPSDMQASGQSTARVELTIEGELAIAGSASAPVVLRGQTQSAGSWYGIVVGAGATGATIQFATVQHATFGVRSLNTGTALAVADTAVSTTSGTGLVIEAGSATIVRSSVAFAQANGVDVLNGASATLLDTVIRSNSGHGVRFSTAAGKTLTIENCTIHGNGQYGVYSATSGNTTLSVKDSVITNNQYGVVRGDSATVTVTHSNVWNNSSSNYSSVGAGTGCISANPLYVGAPANLRLTSNSPSRFGAADGADMGALPYAGDPTGQLVGTLWENTTLTAVGSPHTASGDLTVAPGKTLTIEPGVTLSFTPADLMLSGQSTARGELVVLGTLDAEGTEAQPILLGGTVNSPGSWYGVRFAGTTSSTLRHALIRHATFGLWIQSAGAASIFEFFEVASTSGTGVVIDGNVAPVLDAFTVSGAQANGVDVLNAASATLRNGVVRANSGHGVRFSTAAGKTLAIVNCTIHGNGQYGVYSATSGSTTLSVTNAIVTSNQYGVVRGDSATVTVTYSDVWNNSSANYSSVSAGTGCISANPQYVSSTDLRVLSSSVAVDAGTTGAGRDRLGVSRPLDGNGIGGAQWDMGAYELVLNPVCGNGAIEPGEVCDDGADNGSYGHCNAGCTGQGPRCGDGMVNGGGETCDDGNGSNSDACLSTCVAATCGDGFVRTGVEACDDGNGSNSDACLDTCVAAACGDGFVRAGVEACDDGNGSNADGCLTTCVVAACGDGFTRAGVEECDDANLSNQDACLNNCKAAVCGDGALHTGVEECDDGDLDNGDACTAQCKAAACGDGFVRTGVEQCDDGNTSNTDACTAACKAAACGDGYVQQGVEACDDGNASNTDACSNQCTVAGCGDGIVQAGEQCDDGNVVPTDACTTACKDAACGDGFVRTGVEACDDGNLAPGDGCDELCAVEVLPPDAGPGTPDAGPGTPDAGPGTPDAGPGDPDAAPVTPDAGPGDPAGDVDGAGGCGCRAGGRTGSRAPAGGLGLVVLALAAALLRRSRGGV